MADKLTELIVTALTQAASEPAGLPLIAIKSERGLFPGNVTGKAAAKKAVDEGYLQILKSEPLSAANRELFSSTDQGMHFLMSMVSPKQVLEDFVRILEKREDQVSTLITGVQQIEQSLRGMKDTIRVCDELGP